MMNSHHRGIAMVRQENILRRIQFLLSIRNRSYFLGFARGHRIRSSLPFIIKPAVNVSKSNSLGQFLSLSLFNLTLFIQLILCRLMFRSLLFNLWR
jgi:hypothetical protein